MAPIAASPYDRKFDHKYPQCLLYFVIARGKETHDFKVTLLLGDFKVDKGNSKRYIHPHPRSLQHYYHKQDMEAT